MHIAQWGLYPWFEESGRALIHPEDYEPLKVLIPHGRVFRCVGTVGDYLQIEYRGGAYRVKPDLFSVVRAPLRSFGEKVLIKKSGETIEAMVYDIYWHYKEEKPYYFLTASGRRLSKRYWEKDFL